MKIQAFGAIGLLLAGCGAVTGMRKDWARTATMLTVEDCDEPVIVGDPVLFGGSSMTGADGMKWTAQCGAQEMRCKGRIVQASTGTNRTTKTQVQDTTCK